MTHDSSDTGTIVHLPECPLATACKHDYYDEPPVQCANCGEECLCPALRACEQRVQEEERALIAVEQTTLAELNAEYRKGLDAAREAVERVSSLLQPLGPALAAIDALGRLDTTDCLCPTPNPDCQHPTCPRLENQ